MAEVQMITKSGKKQTFSLEQAQNILDIQKRVPPAGWMLDPAEKGFTIERGKLTPVASPAKTIDNII